jgi:hypothetical protein
MVEPVVWEGNPRLTLKSISDVGRPRAWLLRQQYVEAVRDRINGGAGLIAVIGAGKIRRSPAAGAVVDKASQCPIQGRGVRVRGYSVSQPLLRHAVQRHHLLRENG